MADIKKIKVGVIKEGKIPIDRRVALSPAQCKEIAEKFPEVEILVQSSHIRCFKDSEYREAGFTPQEHVDGCDVLLGVKEVPIGDLAPGKTYFFFSHTIKKQEYNRPLLRSILSRKIRLIDYETLTDENGARLIAFGRYAGLVGAYNGIMQYGKKYKLFDLKPANKCFDMDEMFAECPKAKLPDNLKIALTGSGRVAKGAMETLAKMNIKKVSPADFLQKTFTYPVYAHLGSGDYNKRKDGADFVPADFYAHPELHDGDFMKYARCADMLVACAYWHPKAPKLFSKTDMRGTDFKIKVIADITCDIDGSIPSTKKPSTIEDPAYDYSPESERIDPPYSSAKNITVMAVDNLPCELPRNASLDFGRELIDNILPSLIRDDSRKIIHRATIADAGKLTDLFGYLQNYVDGKE